MATIKLRWVAGQRHYHGSSIQPMVNTKYKGTAEGNTVTADFNFIAAGGGDWQTQAKIPGESKLMGLFEAGPEGTAYKVKVEYTASKEFSANLQLAGADNKGF